MKYEDEDIKDFSKPESSLEAHYTDHEVCTKSRDEPIHIPAVSKDETVVSLFDRPDEAISPPLRPPSRPL